MRDNIVDDLIDDAMYKHLSTAITLTAAGLRMPGQSRSRLFFKIVVHLLFSVLGQARTCQLFVGKEPYSVMVILKDHVLGVARLGR